MESPLTTRFQAAVPAFLSGGNEMGRRVREHNWTATSLGAFTTWPQSLQSALSICLNSNFPIAVYWGKELLLLYNDAWSSIPGDKHPWALGKPAKDVWPEIWADIEPQFEKAFRGEPGGSTDALLPMHRHGYTEECYFDFTFTPIYGESGKVEGIFNAVIETTYRLLNERRAAFLKNLAGCVAPAQSSDELFALAFDAITGAKADLSFALLYSFAEGDIRRVAATPGTETTVQKKPWPFETAARNGEAFLVEDLNDYLWQIPDGFWPEPSKEGLVMALHGASGTPTHFLVCGISPRRRFDAEYKAFLESVANLLANAYNNIVSLEEERKKAEALAEIDKAKTVFFSNISHEFRTPLTLILGSLEETLKSKKATAKQETLEAAHRNAVRLLRLVNNLLDFSRLEAGKEEARFQLTDVASYTADLALGFRPAIEGAGLDFTVRTEAIEQPVYLDREMWEKIVFNLLGNAFKYTLRGGITLSLSSTDDNLFLEVTDTGVGIPESELPNLFQRFHRIENLTGRTFEGTGIGLSLVKELVQLHGGQISVRSKSGKGTAFTVSIPTGKAHLSAEEITDGESKAKASLTGLFLKEAESLLTQPASENGSETNHRKATVLVADDNADMRAYIKNLLQVKFNVVTAANGEEALQRLSEHPLEAIVSDVMMPVMDGIGLLKAVKENPHYNAIPVILLTARAGEESKIEGYETGADDYIVKPFSAKELVARVNTQIRLKESRERALKNLYNIFDEVPFAVAVLKGDSLVIEFINRYNLNVWQQRREDVLGKPLFDVFPGNRSGAEPIHQEIYRTGRRFSATELPIEILTNGRMQTRWFNTIIDPLRNEEGLIIGQLATTIEVTEQVLARKKVEDAKNSMTSLANAMPQVVWIAESNGEVTYYNDRVQEFAGAKKLPDGNWSWEGMVHPDDLRPTAEAWTKAVQEVSVYQKEHRIKMQDGTYRWHLSRGLAHCDEAGKVLNWYGTATDIHDLKEAEEQLRYTAALTENIADAVIGTDTAYHITSWNKGAEELYGYTEAEALGKTARSIIQTEFPNPEDAVAWQNSLDTTGHWKGEVVQHRKDGTPISVLASVALVRNQKGEVMGAVGVNRDIAERKKIETALQRSKEQLELTFQNVPSAIYHFDKNGRILYLNEKGARQMGYASVPEVLAETDVFNLRKRLDETFWVLDENGEPLPVENSSAALSFRTGKPSEVVSKFVHKKTGEVFWLLSKSAVLFDEQGGISMVLTTSTDITLQKTSEQTIRESEEKFRTLAEALPQMVWMRDFTGNIEYASGEWEEYSGIAGLDEAWQTMVHPDDWVAVMAAWEKEYAAGHSFRYEVRLKNKEGEYRWHYAVGEPVRDGAGSITKWIGALTDIHVQKTFSEKLESEVRERTAQLVESNRQLEERNQELANAQSFLQQLIDSSVELISVLDKDLRLVAANKKFEEVMRLPKEEVIGRHVLDYHPVLSNTPQLESIHSALRGQTVYLDKRPSVARPDFYVDTYFVPLLVQGKPEGVIIMSRDVTDIVRSEKLLEEKNKELYRSNEDLQQFAHVASHDLKEPVRKIRTFGSRLKDEFGKTLPNQAKLYVDKMENAAERMYAMIEGVLLYSTLNAVQQPVEKTDLNAVMADIENDLEVAIQQKQGVLRYHNLPVIEGSPVLLYQLFYNLVNNSLKFAKAGLPPVVQVFSSLKQAPPGTNSRRDDALFAEIIVQDNGIGFPPAQAEEIFKTFTRLNARDKYEGTGLGLALCKKIAERHGGTITAESAEGKGARFKILLPVESKQEV